jgi:hypothetical protein
MGVQKHQEEVINDVEIVKHNRCLFHIRAHETGTDLHRPLYILHMNFIYLLSTIYKGFLHI